MRSSRSGSPARRVTVAATIAGALVLTGTAFAQQHAPSATGAKSPATTPGNQARAQSDAKALLAKVMLPAGSTASASPPAGGKAFATPVTLTAYTADATGYWIVAGTPDQAIAYVKAHPPAGLKPSNAFTGNFFGGGDQPDAEETYVAPAVSGVLAERKLVVQVDALTSTTSEIRADGVSVWENARPAWDTIPAATASISISGSFDNAPFDPKTIKTASSVRHVVKLMNGLQGASPGSPCPLPSEDKLAFRSKTGKTVATAVVSSTDRGGVTKCAVALTVGKRRGPALEPTTTLEQYLAQIELAPRAALNRRR